MRGLREGLLVSGAPVRGGGFKNRAHSVGGYAASLSRNGFCGHFTLILFDICQFYQILIQNYTF